jgi:hypothetical protein
VGYCTKVFRGFLLLIIIMGVIPFTFPSYTCDHKLEPNIGPKGAIRGSRTLMLCRFHKLDTPFQPNYVPSEFDHKTKLTDNFRLTPPFHLPSSTFKNLIKGWWRFSSRENPWWSFTTELRSLGFFPVSQL